MSHFLILVIAVIITIITNKILLAFSENLGMRGNEVKQVRWAVTSKPSLGGFAFYIVFLGVMAFLGTQDNGMILISKKQMLGIFVAVTIGFFIGFADDTYNTNPLLKFIGQFSCAIVLFFSDIQIEIINQNQLINFLFTSLWVVGLMNSINMLDNMDAITASSSTSIIIGFLMLININGESDKYIEFLLVGVLGSLLGFLYHNWHPAKMYMGDAGSQFLGVFLAIFSILIAWKERDLTGSNFQFKQFVLPALLFIIPLIDTMTVTYRRLMRGQSPFVGGSDHTTHHLVYLGLKEKMVAILYLIVNGLSLIIVAYIYSNKIYWDIHTTSKAACFFIIIFVIIQVTYNKGLKRKKLVIKP